MSGLSYKKEFLSKKTDKMIRVLRGGNIGNEFYSFKNDDVFISGEYVKTELLLKKNYMITPSVSSLEHIGKIALVSQDYEDVVVGGFVLMLIPFFNDDIISKYLLYAFATKYHRDNCRNITHKSGQAFYNLSREKLMNLPIPFPPYAEMKRIIIKLSTLLSKANEYSKIEKENLILNNSFPDSLKKSILQEAVQGKLVPQDPNDEPASVLLERIRAEKQALIEAGKIKKDKNESVIFRRDNIYAWRSNSIVHILENRQYTGCTVNGKSTTVSYKVHKKIEKSQEDYQIIPNTQEAIISENTWLRVQELRRNKRRNTVTGRKSLFSGLVCCADCGSKLHFCAAKSLKKNQEFWRCSSYKDGRGTCTIHFIRDVVLEVIVKEAISELADFVRCYNSAFLYLISEKKGAESINREKSLQAKTESAKQRISDLDKLFSRIYEDNLLGKLSDERYSRMASEYEIEQKQLMQEVEENEKTLSELQKQTVDMKMLYQGLMEFTEMKQLTPTVVNKLIERIEIHNNEKKHSHNNVKVDIYFTAVGLFDIPTEQQLIDTMERVKQKNAEKSA